MNTNNRKSKVANNLIEFRHDSVENKMVLFNSNDKSIVICEGVAEPFSQLSTSPSQSHQPSICPYCSQNMPRKQRKSNSPPNSTSTSQVRNSKTNFSIFNKIFRTNLTWSKITLIFWVTAWNKKEKKKNHKNQLD